MDRITITAAADQTGFHRRTLHRWIKAGKVKVERTPGGQPYLTSEELQKIMPAGAIDV